MDHQRRAACHGRILGGFGRISFSFSPSDQMSQFFGEKSEEYMSCTENGTELRDISCFFAEFEAAVGVIEEKYNV